MLPKRYPDEQLGEMIFCLENPPHKRGYISGTLDSLGILGHGAKKFTYRPGAFFPSEQESLNDESVLGWLEDHVYLKHSWCRSHDCRIAVNPGHPQFSYHCRALHDAACQCWESIRARDIGALSAALNQSRHAQAAIVPGHCPSSLADFIREQDALGAMIMGAGGGGYVAFVDNVIPSDAIRIQIRRGEL